MADREVMLMKNVWVPAEKEFKFAESKNPQTGERRYIMSGLMMPFGQISRNNVLYNKASVVEHHKSLIGRPVMYNHQVEGLELPVGHYTESYVDESGWHYKADIDPAEEKMIRKLERGDLRHVSIQLVGGRVIEKYDPDGRMYTEAYVSDIIEGSIVPAPGFLDTTASFAEALRIKEDMTMGTAGDAVATKLPGAGEEEEDLEEQSPMHALIAELGEEKAAEFFINKLGEETVRSMISEIKGRS